MLMGTLYRLQVSIKLSELTLTKEQIFTTPVLIKPCFIIAPFFRLESKSKDIESKKCKILHTDVKRNMLKQRPTVVLYARDSLCTCMHIIQVYTIETI